jgi:Xaa-Pro aminopeptidase
MEKLRISVEEHKSRQTKLLEELDRRNLKGACLFGNTAIKYLTGFNFIPTERPMAFVLTKDEAVMFVPKLEEKHCLIGTALDRSVSYPEYPGERHSIYTLKDLLVEMNLDNKKIGVDAGGYPHIFGYEGPSLKEMLPNIETENIAYHIVEMRMIKSENEIELIKASAKWGDRVHELLQKYTVPGVSEIQVSMRASMEATREMIEILGDKYVAMGGRGVSAGYRGQIGPHSALPHSQTINAIFKPGDTLVTGAGGDLGGYHSELERTMFVGKPSDEQIKYFDLMYEAQQIAFDNIKPGEPYGVVDEAVRSFFDKNDLWEYWRHHQGHNIGLEGHEAPFFDIGDDSIMKPGMVVSVEPGIYVPGLGGFRHSDTGVITNDGFEIITHYPRELKDLICG